MAVTETTSGMLFLSRRSMPSLSVCMEMGQDSQAPVSRSSTTPSSARKRRSSTPPPSDRNAGRMVSRTSSILSLAVTTGRSCGVRGGSLLSMARHAPESYRNSSASVNAVSGRKRSIPPENIQLFEASLLRSRGGRVNIPRPHAPPRSDETFKTPRNGPRGEGPVNVPTRCSMDFRCTDPSDRPPTGPHLSIVGIE
jgi:hypothetical protein